MARARKIQNFLSQPFHVAEQFTGIPGKYVPLKDSIRSFKMIVNGELDDVPEQAFYMVGPIEDVFEQAKKLDAGLAMALPTKIVLEVVTPMGLLLREEVDEVIAPGEDGYFGVRPGHTPFLSTLGPGRDHLPPRRRVAAPHLLLGLLRGAARPREHPGRGRRARRRTSTSRGPRPIATRPSRA